MKAHRRSMKPASARETMLDLIDELTISLEELQQREEAGDLDAYCAGIKTAQVQLLEFIQQRWEDSFDEGLDFNIEERFPV